MVVCTNQSPCCSDLSRWGGIGDVSFCDGTSTGRLQICGGLGLSSGRQVVIVDSEGAMVAMGGVAGFGSGRTLGG